MTALNPNDGAYRALKPVETNHWDDWKESCSFNADCGGDSQKCTKLLWEGKNDEGKTFASGSACYDWKISPCKDTEYFSTRNSNYAKSDEFSYYT